MRCSVPSHETHVAYSQMFEYRGGFASARPSVLPYLLSGSLSPAVCSAPQLVLEDRAVLADQGHPAFMDRDGFETVTGAGAVSTAVEHHLQREEGRTHTFSPLGPWKFNPMLP